MKLLIEYPEGMGATDALELAKITTREGRISETSKGKQFCFAILASAHVLYASKTKTQDKIRIEVK